MIPKIGKIEPPLLGAKVNYSNKHIYMFFNFFPLKKFMSINILKLFIFYFLFSVSTGIIDIDDSFYCVIGGSAEIFKCW